MRIRDRIDIDYQLEDDILFLDEKFITKIIIDLISREYIRAYARKTAKNIKRDKGGE